MVRRLEPNLSRCDVSLCVQVFLHLASEVKKMSSGSESDSFANLSSSFPFLSVFFLSAMLV